MQIGFHADPSFLINGRKENGKVQQNTPCKNLNVKNKKPLEASSKG